MGQKRQLSAKYRRIVQALLPILLPTTEKFSPKSIEPTVLAEAASMLDEYPRLTRWGFLWGMVFFNRAPVLFGYGLVSFVRLSATNQQRYVAQWPKSSFQPFRFLFRLLKIFFMMLAYAQPELWQELDYHPEAHMNDRIRLRKEILKATP